MTYLVTHPLTCEYWEIEDRSEAETKLAEVCASVLSSEDFKFTVIKEIVSGSDTTWVNANLNSDPENHYYRLFNAFTGQHEPMNSLTEVKNRKQELLNQVLINLNLGSVKEFNGWPNLYMNNNPHTPKDLPVVEL